MTSSSKEPRQKLNPDARVDSQTETETKTSSNEWLSLPLLLPGSIFTVSDLKTNLRRLFYPFDLAYFTFTQYDKSQKLYTHSKQKFNIESDKMYQGIRIYERPDQSRDNLSISQKFLQPVYQYGLKNFKDDPGEPIGRLWMVPTVYPWFSYLLYSAVMFRLGKNRGLYSLLAKKADKKMTKNNPKMHMDEIKKA